jgi:DivIVA domain-containing protein
MPLTPEAVQNKEFTTVRLREGYDMQEVDEFLDEVEAEIARLQRENDELRDKLAAVTRGAGAVGSAEPVQPPRQVEAPKAPPTSAAPAVAPAAGAPGAQPSDAAAKVLALAQKTADELVADAKAEADRLMSEARSRSEKLDSETKAKAAKLEQDARQRAESIDQEIQKRRAQVFGKLETERADLERQLEGLRAFEREYRSRLKSYLENELRKLEVGGASDEERAEAEMAAAQAQQQQPQQPQRPAPNNTGQQAPVRPGGNENVSATQTGGSLRSVASLLDDDQR